MAKVTVKPHLFWFGLALAVLVTESALFSIVWSSFTEADRQTVRTYSVIQKLEAMASSVKDAETGQRGFLLTGEDWYLSPFEAGARGAITRLDELDSLAADTPELQLRVRTLRPVVEAKLAELRETVALKRAGNSPAALAVVSTGRGKRLMERIRTEIRALSDNETATLEDRKRHEARTGRAMVVLMIGGAALLFAVLLGGARAISRSIAARERAEEADRTRREWLQVTLASIGDGVIATDAAGRVTLMNKVAEQLTGWESRNALGQPLESVFVILNENSGAVVPNPALRSMREGRIIGLSNHTVLVAADGRRIPLDDSGAPILDPAGTVRGSVLIFRDATPKKLLDAELRRRDRMLRFSRDAIIIADAERKIVSWNRGAAELYGWNDSEAQGRIIHDLLRTTPDMRPIDDILASHGEWAGELTHTCKDGRALTVESRQLLLRDPDGAVTGILEINRDVTARKRAEEALEEHRRWLEVTLNSIGDAVLATDSEGFVTYLNPVASALTGWAPTEAVGRPAREVLRIFNEQTGAPAEDIIERVLEEKRAVALANHTALAARDGRTVPIEDSAAPICDSEGRLLGAVLVFHDVAEKRRAQQQLLASEARERERAAELQATMDATPLAVFVAHDPECRHITGNRAAYELLRLRLGANVSKSAIDSPPAYRTMQNGVEVLAADLPAQVAARTGRRIRDCELDLILEDGTVRTVVGDAVPLLDPAGNPRGSVSAFMDITEWKRTQERLRDAQKLESVGLLAGGIAHDFNNLLVGVIGNASLAQDMLPGDHEAAEFLAQVVRTGEQLAHLTRQMLAYSGKGRFFMEKLNLSSLIPEMAGLIHPSIPKKVSLVLDLDPRLPRVEADRGQLQQVFMNLVLNAAEAIGSQSGTITVRTTVQPVDASYFDSHPEAAGLSPGAYVCLEVRDTGCGMDEATKARVFEPFFSTKFTGRGLGLAAVSGIVRGHKGAIEVSSVPGRGSCFRVLFPAAGPAEEAQTQDRVAAAGACTGTILVVDDEEVVRSTARHALSRHGFEVLLAADGAEAIDTLKRHPGRISLVLLDLSLPGMGGEETLPELRKIRPGLKAVISSGYNEVETLALFERQTPSGFIQKPYTAGELVQKLRSVLEDDETPPKLRGRAV